ncbi:DUF302 domain-containing protein [Gudongella sp. DL1XJH-153]|uniref:DUF302 domain-containing protein n=1 Tax=Gudongella sp. DL1XJH-153 TaxID=3409804 RepID=UPI003BB5B5BE
MDINYKVKTNKSFEKAIEDLKVSLSNYNFGVLWELSFKDKLHEKGLDFDKNINILEVCNPKQAAELLEKNIEVGYFLPCKVVVYENDNSVFIGMIRPSMLVDMLNDNRLSDIASNIEKDLKSSIEDAS